ncbi:uncharacterized protein LOC128885211 [Hylaeus volcanicus]|uniref:uncharacterized protein LOC128885211 n=1 Tax=Hylaeus volcanicus TaxID=313075 RepID=UPI0023B86060|nr:uncharacterized protein LOC128885211 [Hylaeus volcanicus]
MSEELINESLLGIAAVHGGLVVLEDCQTILRKDYKNMIGQVKIISGGRAENKLPYTECVGHGMLTAAILGNTCAPSQSIIMRVIEEFEYDYSSGILLIIDNYADYSINFHLAKFHAEEKGYIIKVIQIPTHSLSITEEQGFLASFFMYKIAGAMSEEGKNIDEIYNLCKHIVQNREIVLLKTEYENIIHKECDMEMLSNSVKEMFKPMINVLNTMNQDKENKELYETNDPLAIGLQTNPFATYCVGHDIAIMINNLGCSQLETYTFIYKVLKQTKVCSFKIKQVYLKPLITNSNTKGFNVCILNLSINPVLIKYLDFPTTAPAWPKVLTSDVIEMKKDDKINVTTSGKYCKNGDTLHINIKGPTIKYETSKIFLSVISVACEAIIACAKQLNRIDQEFGNGNYGTNLARGAEAIKDTIQENKIFGTSPYATFIQIGHIIDRTVDGLQGKLYTLFFFNFAKAFSEYESNKQITTDMWLNALVMANKEIGQFQLFDVGDKTMITALTTIQFYLANALNENTDPINAFGVAVKAAENFAMNTVHVQSSSMKTYNELKYPYPQAHAIGIWMRGAYEEDGQYECEGCQSIGNVKYLSNEHETRTSFLSAQQSLTQDVWCLLKHACFRSLSCEVHPGKEGVCYFGDEYRGHVLSHTFTLKDAQARGFRRWCSFIVFMRDKQFLLNMWPFLVDNLKEVIRELQDFAEKKYNAEEAECPQRIVRLTTANNGSRSYNPNKQPRTFRDITNEEHVFIRIHMWLVWILSAGARHCIEIFPMSLLDDELSYNLEHQIETEEGFTLVNAKLPVNLNLNSNESEATSEFSEVSGKSTTVILRDLRTILGKDQFRQLLYSSLTGVQILVRGPSIQRLESLYGLSSLIPCACRRVKARATEYMDPNKCNFIGMDISVAVPLPCASVCRLDIMSDEHKVENSQSHVVRWTGSLPLKLPTLLTKIEKSLDNEKLGNSTLKAHFAALQEEWANIAKVVHAMRGRGHSGDLSGLMLSLGAGPHDKKLLDAWSMGLPPNPA